MIKAFLILLFTLLIGSCATVEHAPCVNERTKNIEISWGDFDVDKNHKSGYLLDAYGNLYALEEYSGRAEKEKLYNIGSENYCELLKEVREEIIKVQTLSAPGRKPKFVEYSDPVNNATMRVLWDSEQKTKLSEGFRKIYNELEEIAKEK